MDDRDIKFKLDPPAVIALIIVFVISAALLATFTGGHGIPKLIIVVLISIAFSFIVSLIVQYIFDSRIYAKMQKQASMYGFIEDEEEDNDEIEDYEETNPQYEELRTENFMDKYQSLEKLAELKEKGILSEEEFNAEKAKVLNGTSFVQPRPAPKAESQESQPIIINNSNSNVNTVYAGMNAKNKWVALLLCIFLGIFGGHKFYEGKILLGIVYLCTFGLAGIGVLVDFFAILFKPNPYYC